MNQRIRTITTASVCAASICVLSMISVNFGGVAFSLSLLAVLLSGLMLTPLYAFASNIVYVLLGVFGLPIFAGFTGGLGVLFGKSGGFIISYPIVALIVSLFIKLRGFCIWSVIIAFVISVSFCYLVGAVWFMTVTKLDIYTSIMYCVLPFVPIDILKCSVAYIVATKIRKYTNNA